ncbi:putative ribose-phosphate diphosphokinase [Helianthus debilis subsp. tardiflorus]
MNLIGDVKGKVAVMVDDMIDTAGTIAKGADLLHREGAGKFMHAAHMLFSVDMFYGSPPTIERLSSGLFQEVIITNTIPVSEKNYLPQLTVLSVANLLGESIWRVHDDYPPCGHYTRRYVASSPASHDINSNICLIKCWLF